jgi:hypothetical protein
MDNEFETSKSFSSWDNLVEYSKSPFSLMGNLVRARFSRFLHKEAGQGLFFFFSFTLFMEKDWSFGHLGGVERGDCKHDITFFFSSRALCKKDI